MVSENNAEYVKQYYVLLVFLSNKHDEEKLNHASWVLFFICSNLIHFKLKPAPKSEKTKVKNFMVRRLSMMTSWGRKQKSRWAWTDGHNLQDRQ